MPNIRKELVFNNETNQFDNQVVEILYESKHMLSEKNNKYHITFYNVLDILGDMGGLFSAVFGILALAGNIITRDLLLEKITRAIYIAKSVTSK